MLKIIHRLFAVISTLCITTFLISTLISEFFMQHNHIIIVKNLIVCPGLFILIPSIVLTGITGALIAKNRKGNIIKRKKKRMPFIALNGLFILIPAAIYLKANSSEIGQYFITVQTVEVLAGMFNLTLLLKNILDGRKLGGKNV